VKDIFSNPAHPDPEGLLEALPRLGASDQRLALIPGQPPSMADLPQGCRFAPRCKYATDVCREEYPDWTSTPARRAACWYAAERLL
jgi:oligopeptide/dipeptide ABC transporter ATP-binding protein